jgi:hypothetical protein
MSVFESGHYSIQSACLKGAKNGREQVQQFHKANCRNLIRAFDDRSHTCDSC